MNATEKRQLETELLKMGLAGLSANGDPTPELVQQLAGMVNNWPGHENRHGEWIDRHKFLRDLLAECDEDKRYDMYTAIVPHLKFQPRPLAAYESMMTERMSNLVGKRAARIEGRAPHPVEIGGTVCLPTADEAAATHVMATLRCLHCGKYENVLGDTPVGAMIAARKAGWVRDMALKKEICPDCWKKRH